MTRRTGAARRRKLFETTVGRVIFNDMLPAGMPFYNFDLNKSLIGYVIQDCHKILGKEATIELLDAIKSLGFKAATRAGPVVRQGRHEDAERRSRDPRRRAEGGREGRAQLPRGSHHRRASATTRSSTAGPTPASRWARR
jgi:DNA-directed RNA polymerase beta' subunit